MRWRGRACLIGLIACALSPSPAAAQSPRRVITVSAGFGETDPLPLELPFIARTWTVAVQVAAAKHLTIEAATSGWRHESSTTSRDVLIVPGADPVILKRSTEASRTATFTASLNALATARLGRVRLSSGAGAGMSAVNTELTVTETDCAIPQSCHPYHSKTTLPLLAVQCVLGADVILTPRLQAFFTYRLIQPFSEALAEVSYVAGLRVAVR